MKIRKRSIAAILFLLVILGGLFSLYEVRKTESEIRAFIQRNPEYSQIRLERFGIDELSIEGKFRSPASLLKFVKEEERLKSKRLIRFRQYISYPNGTSEMLRQALAEANGAEH